MTMKTYWDYSERERGEMTSEDVTRLLDAELMVKGVLKAQPLVLVPVAEDTTPTSTFYRIRVNTYEVFGDIAFRTAEDARAVLALRPVAVKRDWTIGDIKAAVAAPTVAEATIESCSLASEDDIAARKAALSAIKEAKDENDKRRAAFDKQTRAVTEALKGLWEDWYRCTAQGRRMKEIAATFAEYTTMAGDEATARRFLARAFPADEIVEAQVWTGIGMVTDAVEARPAAVAQQTDGAEVAF